MADVDCSRCTALCCVALAFDRSDEFAFDKAAGEPCPHLDDDDRCRVHRELAARGFNGCVRYDCGGAGVEAVRSVGRSWREDFATATALFEAFSVHREVGEARALLATAHALPLGANDESRRQALESRLEASTWHELAPQVAAFFRSLRRLPLVR